MKYVRTFKPRLYEQAEAPAAEVAPGVDPAAQAQAVPVPVKVVPYTFIFMNDLERDRLKRKKFPDGSYQIDFPSYSVNPDELEEWVNKNVVAGPSAHTSSELDIRRQNLIDIVRGKQVNISSKDIPFIEKLRNAVTTDIFGKKDPKVPVVFSPDGTPTTNDVDVTFIKYKKK